MIGIHWCARFGQFTLKIPRSPWLFFGKYRPLAGFPRYVTENCLHSPARDGGTNEMVSRSPRCE